MRFWNFKAPNRVIAVSGNLSAFGNNLTLEHHDSSLFMGHANPLSVFAPRFHLHIAISVLLPNHVLQLNLL